MKSLLMFCLLAFAGNSFAREEYQLGVILGSPTGISAKVGILKDRSVDMALAYSLADDLGLEFHADYLIENAHAFNINAPSPLELFFGMGFRLAVINKGRHDDDLAIGPRVPVGVIYKINNPNIEFFAELALALDIVPDTDVALEAGLGARYRF